MQEHKPQRNHAHTMHATHRYNMKGDLMAGANIYGFLRVANAMVKQGAV